jgi:hypothetical protein
VLGQAIKDVYDTRERVRTETIAWLGTPDFEAVCHFADVEPDQMRNQMASLANLSRGLAMKYGQLLRMQVEGDGI